MRELQIDFNEDFITLDLLVDQLTQWRDTIGGHAIVMGIATDKWGITVKAATLADYPLRVKANPRLRDVDAIRTPK